MRYLFTISGFLFLVLGLVGVYLPILPTTPFLLLSATCFAKGSEKFHLWLIETSLYEKNIKPIKDKNGMEKGAKIRILSIVSLLVLTSFVFMESMIGRTVLVLVLLGHYYFFFFKVKTKIKS